MHYELFHWLEILLHNLFRSASVSEAAWWQAVMNNIHDFLQSLLQITWLCLVLDHNRFPWKIVIYKHLYLLLSGVKYGVNIVTLNKPRNDNHHCTSFCQADWRNQWLDKQWEWGNENEVEVPSSVINHGFLLLFNFSSPLHVSASSGHPQSIVQSRPT
jgi:hypothetical protein